LHARFDALFREPIVATTALKKEDAQQQSYEDSDAIA
jgi:hypothetical protein